MLIIILLVALFLLAVPFSYSLDSSTSSVSSYAAPVLSENTQYEMLDYVPFEGVQEKRVSFYAVGDNLIHAPIFNYAQVDETSYDFKPIYQQLAADIESADIAYINQETILGGDDRGFSGYPSFNTPSDMAENLVDLGFDIVNGSNNHTLDMGTSGVLNTLDYWSAFEEEVLFTGAFESQEHRDTIPIYETDGLSFSVLTYTYGTNGILPDAPYRVNYFDPALITQDVARAKELSDFVIVAAHWGDEHAFEPNAMQLDYAQLFADLEVDVVVGSHSHTIQPIEWVEGENGNETLIIYSLGNLVAATTSDINLLGGAVEFDFVQKGTELAIEDVNFEPFVIHYEAAIPGEITTRTNFEVIKLADYTTELEAAHALNGHNGNVISVESYQELVNEVIAEEFRD